MNHIMPPMFLRSILLCVVAERDREAIDGDLLEAYAERKNTVGGSSANAWYAFQVCSLVLYAFPVRPKAIALALLCCFTALGGTWLGAMDILLHHRNIAQHEVIAGLIVSQGLLTLMALPLRRWTPLKWLALAGTFGVSYLGASALWSTLHTSDTEGYILVIAMLLLVQSALTWSVLGRPIQAVTV